MNVEPLLQEGLPIPVVEPLPSLGSPLEFYAKLIQHQNKRLPQGGAPLREIRLPRTERHAARQLTPEEQALRLLGRAIHYYDVAVRAVLTGDATRSAMAMLYVRGYMGRLSQLRKGGASGTRLHLVAPEPDTARDVGSNLHDMR